MGLICTFFISSGIDHLAGLILIEVICFDSSCTLSKVSLLKPLMPSNESNNDSGNFPTIKNLWLNQPKVHFEFAIFRTYLKRVNILALSRYLTDNEKHYQLISLITLSPNFSSPLTNNL